MVVREFVYTLGLKGKSGFGSSTTAEKVTSEIDLSTKFAIVTGSSSGLGKETARVLALRGAHVVIAVRNMEAGESTKKKIEEKNSNAKVTVMKLDLSSFESVRDFVEEYKSKEWPLHMLINNAGVMACPYTLSKDGHEIQFATNHLGHFLLTKELLPILKATADASALECRIVNVASMAHIFAPKGGIQFTKINDKESYKPWAAYGQSKLANILHAKELARLLKDEGVTNVTVNALCPGGIRTDLQRHIGPSILLDLPYFFFSPLFKSVPQGAATSCYVSTHPSLVGVSGKYFYDCNEGKEKRVEAEDMELAQKLWKYSEELVRP